MNATQIRVACAGLAAIFLPGILLALFALLVPGLAYPLADSRDAWVGALLAAVQGSMLSLVGCAFMFVIWRVMHVLGRTEPWIFVTLGLIGGLVVVYLSDLTAFWRVAYPVAGTLSGLAVWAIAYFPNRRGRRKVS